MYLSWKYQIALWALVNVFHNVFETQALGGIVYKPGQGNHRAR